MRANPFGWWDKFNAAFYPPERLADAERASDGGNEVVILNEQILFQELRERAGKYDEEAWHSWLHHASANALAQLQRQIEVLTVERDAALGRIDELEEEARHV